MLSILIGFFMQRSIFAFSRKNKFTSLLFIYLCHEKVCHVTVMKGAKETKQPEI